VKVLAARDMKLVKGNGASRLVSLQPAWETDDMKGTFGAFLRRPLIIATLTASILATSVTAVSATSVATAKVNAPSVCGVVASPGIHFVSKGSPCVIRVRLGATVHLTFRSGFRWGYPASNSKSVVVTTISRTSRGVFAATLHAAALGHATVRASGTVACKPGVACPDLALLWTLKVIVTKNGLAP
jgi:hypothetical protein